ncbi:MAG: hypothetical protein Q8P61_06295 [Candidatus Nanopelagicales bacterium]|nr:hypothetical protein [Candidatus Nanopelagicales bacterium]
MANDYDITARAVGVDAIAALALRVALHTGDPGAANTADNEVTGGSPAYARHYEPNPEAPTDSGKLPMLCPRAGTSECTKCPTGGRK